MEKVTDRELTKWLKILGSRMIANLYVESKLYLTSKQLDMLVEHRKEEKNNESKNK